MTCAPAAAVLTPTGAQAAARPAKAFSDNAPSATAPKAARNIAGASLNRGTTRANSATPTPNAKNSGDSSTDNDTESTGPQGFADIIRQIASASAPSQPSPSVPTQGILSRTQLADSRWPLPVRASEDAESDGSSPLRQPSNKKNPNSPALSAFAASDSALSAPVDRARQQDTLAIPVDVIVPQSPLRLRLSDLSGASGAQQAQLRSESASGARLTPEAALTVVIRAGDAPVTPQQGEFQESASPTTAQAPANPDNTVTSPDSAQSVAASGEIASVPGPQDGPASEPVAQTDTNPVGAISPSTEPERKRNVTEVGAINDVPRGSPLPAAAPQTAPVRAEVARSAGSPPQRNAAPQPSASVREPVPPEKSAAQPLRSVSLEFTPDGSKDVRVRLSERAGEVHVSLHSTDPSTTKSLRDGVTDLASVLANAGYDAQTWTSGRQRQDNPQQENPAQRRGARSGGGIENFDGILQQPDHSKENS